MKRKLKVNDFFCGCGGMGIAFKNAGYEIAGAWDFDKYAVESYRANVGDHVQKADIKELHQADMAYSVINEALNNSCHNIDSEAAREQMQKQIYKSVVHCTPYESIYDVMCGRRQFYDYRNEFITAVAEGLGMLPGSRTKRNTGCSSTTGT